MNKNKKSNEIKHENEMNNKTDEIKKENQNKVEEINVKEEKKEDWETKAKDYYEQILRLKADFENYRKRIEKEKPQLIEWGKKELILKIFPLYEILLSAHQHITRFDYEKCSKEQIEELIKGLDLIFKEFSKLFEGEGIRQMDLLNKPYDPMMCEIIGIVDGNDDNDGLVVEVIQNGYMIDSQILRPAKVKIAKNKVEEKSKNENEIGDKK